LLAELGGCSVEEERGVGAAGDAPDGVGGSVIVPGCYFLDNTDSFVWFGNVGAKVVEALGGVGSYGLEERSVRVQR
jgi:hypothetical protein